MKLKAVINLFGGPCTGKSTVAGDVFVTMKKQGKHAELVYEYAKELTYDQRQNILETDQLYVFAKQHRKLSRLADQVEYAIVDSPLLLSCIYFNGRTNLYTWRLFEDFIHDTFNKYPNYNFLLKAPESSNYQAYGRNQNYEQALAVQHMMQDYLDKQQIPYIEIEWDSAVTTILKYIEAE